VHEVLVYETLYQEDESLADRALRFLRVCLNGGRSRARAAAPLLALAVFGSVASSPAAGEQLTLVCDLHYQDGNSDQTTVEIDTSVPSINGKTDGEVEDFNGPCTHRVSVTANSFSWARDCRRPDGEKSRSDSFAIDRLTGYYRELSSVGDESHVYRASGTCEKRRNLKPLN